MFGKSKKDDEISTIDIDKEEKNEKTVETEDEKAVTMSWKEMKALKRSKYDEKSSKYNKSFVIRHKKTGMIVELRAASVLQAASFIGWRPRHTVLIKEKDVTVEKEAQDKIDAVNAEIENKKENCPALT